MMLLKIIPHLQIIKKISRGNSSQANPIIEQQLDSINQRLGQNLSLLQESLQLLEAFRDNENATQLGMKKIDHTIDNLRQIIYGEDTII